MRRWGWVAASLLALGCGSSFGTSDATDAGTDASSGSGGTGAVGGSGGTGAVGGSGGTGAVGGSGGTGAVGGSGGTGAVGGSGGTGGAGGAGGVAGSGGSLSCEGICVPPVPAGWEGPFLVDEDSAETPVPSCGGAFPNEGPAPLLGEIQVDNNCPCACKTQLKDPSTAEVQRFSTTGCTGTPCGTTVVSSNDCVLQSASVCAGGTVAVRTVAQGFCAVDGPTAPPPPIWNVRSRACAPSDVTTCDGSDELCVPAPAQGGAFCILRQGDLGCPAGPYSVRRNRFTGAEDSRTCSACVCQPTTKVGILQPSASATCTPPGSQTIEVPTACAAWNATAGSYVDFQPMAGVNPNCQPVAIPEMTGDLELTGPTTLCCLP